MVKKIIFFITALLLVIFSIEIGTRLIYFIKRGKTSYLMSQKEVSRIRKDLPYEKNNNKQFVRGNFLIRNGYYTFNPEIKTLREGLNNIKLNSLGFRGSGFERKIRILCLGGSSTYGHSTHDYSVRIPYPEMMDSFLNKGIKKRQQKYTVINGGMEAFNIQHIYNLLRDREFIKKINPDMLVINTFWNSIEQYENGLLVETIDNRFIRGFVKRSVFAFLSYRVLLFLEYNELTGPFQSLCVYLDKICQIAEKRGISIILVNEPMLLDAQTWTAAPNNPNVHNKGAIIFKRFEKKYPGMVFFVPMPFFDRMDFKKDEVKKYFIDRGHLTMEGYAIEARILSDAIKDLTKSQW
ncbi:MAG: hypothetical protein PHC54_00665 [Candidatus Omnitrophica bacterium]|nr:hypothetical protein [Candidatus Omnitrophota bacterium]MDD5591910.1 hypothetical protein [Candidatus Omnitrophota bacterium]